MMGVREIGRCLEQWRMEVKDLRRRMILAPTPRERERWYAILLLAQGWTAAATAEALERDPHTIGRWASAYGPDIRADRWFPPALDQAQQEELKAAVQEPPGASGINLATWYWKAVRQFAGDRFSIGLSRSSCLNWLHRLGFAFKRPKKRLLKADEAKRGPSWRSTPPCGRRPNGLKPGYSLLMRPTSGRTRNCGASGC